MKIRNLKIGIQLLLGFGALLIFVIILSVVSFLQSSNLHQQTDDLYNHPLIVRRALGMLRSDFITIHRDMKNLFLTADETEITEDLQRIEQLKVNAFEQIDIISSQYLGPRADVDSVKRAFVKWNATRDETIRLLREGKRDDALPRIKNSGSGGRQAADLLKALDVIDKFATSKGDELYKNSVKTNESFEDQLIALVAVIVSLSLVIYYYLLSNIRKPLNELTKVSRQFHQGDMNARSSYRSLNEFGILSESFNSLAYSIQENAKLNDSASILTGLMLSEEDAGKFFHATLNALCEHTGSQMAAVYLLSEDKKNYDHFASIGIDNHARQSFAAGSFEGEFGISLASGKMQHIKEIAADTRFNFKTVSGTFIPAEIITIPLLTGNEITAIISLANVNKFSQQSVRLINKILDTLSARVEGILVYRKVKEFSEKLEQQFFELEAQKQELQSQSDELMEQNVELETQKQQLGEASRLKTNFLSNMSHELRTPLNSVIALSGVLNRRLVKKIPAEEYSYLEVIERNGKQLLSLINDILDISRIEAGREEVEITRFNINNLISEVVSTIKPQADQKKILLIHSESQISIPITSDLDKCRHILQNLVGNAVKFTETGKVEIVARLNGKQIRIEVIDTGIGIPEAHQQHVFDEFRQADGSTSRKFGGTGLGLAIAKKYANLLGGTIGVNSVPGEGSAFMLSLPLSYAEGNMPKETAPVTKPHFQDPVMQSSMVPNSRNLKKTILLVEDSEPAIIQMHDFLEESGFHILLARDGNEALDILSKTLPDAIILDLMMPGVDGFEVLGNLRDAERTAHVPVLILTAKHITKDELRYLKRNNVHQLIQKGDVNRIDLLSSLDKMFVHETEPAALPKPVLNTIEGKPLVLVVEDNSDNMLTVKALLSENFDVIGAIDGMKAIEMAREHSPDLILMDIALPGMDGISVFKAIRKEVRLQHIPIIALTASAMVQDRETILAHGFEAYIAKPIDEKQFFEIINETLYG